MRFIRVGVNAGAANFPRELRMQEYKDTKEIIIKKGKVILERSVVNSSFPGILEKPGAKIFIAKGIKISTKRTRKRSV